MSAPTQQEIERLLAAQDRATRESDYADTIKMDYQQIEGTRYKFRLSETPAER
jgi:hypothetical protein